ncbi:retrovirus-related Pol polyprotein from type-1 retrotransposable element R2 [Nephila pilipes]|uniref:Retrovirus-related Pol polyprotein from type-1 retrotransposable element R2 n=1 Tax=Nephila pilipes TaxID=299642 RepID=A0A8X6U3Z2_NEPPI|nr:retrovirus-related Pol polyprotein from type-1 retrotransposable element R2 [Nephila pilipes]
MYEGASTAMLSSSGLTNEIPNLRGVKQCCPLRGILFDIVIHHVINSVQDDYEVLLILAFADDLVLLENGESFSYLGKSIGFQFPRQFASTNDAIEVASKIVLDKLVPWKKIDALKFFFPALNRTMRTAQLNKGDWTKIDTFIRMELKYTLYFLSNASNFCLYGSREFGCCGILEEVTDSDLFLIDTAFKLLSAKEDFVVNQAFSQLARIIRFRTKRPPTDVDMAAYLSGSLIDEFFLLRMKDRILGTLLVLALVNC